MSDETHENTLHFLNAHVHMLNHSTVKHACGHSPSSTFLLQVVEALEDEAFPVGETVSDVWEIGTRITGRHEAGFLLYEGSGRPRHDSPCFYKRSHTKKQRSFPLPKTTSVQ